MADHYKEKNICCAKEKRSVRRKNKLCDKYNIDKKDKIKCRGKVARESHERSKQCMGYDTIQFDV